MRNATLRAFSFVYESGESAFAYAVCTYIHIYVYVCVSVSVRRADEFDQINSGQQQHTTKNTQQPTRTHTRCLCVCATTTSRPRESRAYYAHSSRFAARVETTTTLLGMGLQSNKSSPKTHHHHHRHRHHGGHQRKTMLIRRLNASRERVPGNLNKRNTSFCSVCVRGSTQRMCSVRLATTVLTHTHTVVSKTAGTRARAHKERLCAPRSESGRAQFVLPSV